MEYAITKHKDIKKSQVTMKNGKTFWYQAIYKCEYPPSEKMPEGLILYSVGNRIGTRVCPPQLLSTRMWIKLNPGIRTDFFEQLSIRQDINQLNNVPKQIKAIEYLPFQEVDINNEKTPPEPAPKKEKEVTNKDLDVLTTIIADGVSAKLQAKKIIIPIGKAVTKDELMNRALNLLEAHNILSNRILDLVEYIIKEA